VRAAGFSAEVYPEEKKLAQQLKYADQRGFPLALIAGSRELDEGKVQIKNLLTKVATEVVWRDDPEGFVEALRNMMKLGTDTLLA
jgi:histidyl-tRNA synthetase